jgi:hypothetical protein
VRLFLLPEPKNSFCGSVTSMMELFLSTNNVKIVSRIALTIYLAVLLKVTVAQDFPLLFFSSVDPRLPPCVIFQFAEIFQLKNAESEPWGPDPAGFQIPQNQI